MTPPKKPVKSERETPRFGAKIRGDFIEGIGKVNGKFVILLNVRQVLSRSEIGAMGLAAANADEHALAA